MVHGQRFELGGLLLLKGFALGLGPGLATAVGLALSLGPSLLAAGRRGFLGKCRFSLPIWNAAQIYSRSGRTWTVP
jgi:hypothetical protein